MGSASGSHLQAVTPEAFAAFYDGAFPDVYRYLARAVLGDRAVAEDLTQETFASVVATIRAGGAVSLTVPWIMGVARHKLVDHYRSNAREQRRLALAWSSGEGRDDDAVDDLFDADPGRLSELMGELSPDHRMVLVLKYLDELSVDQIADEIGRSVHATESLLARARRALAQSYRGQQP
jgi:RNA polymerase sigma-70 factor (ECF subfamily)